MLLVRFNFLSLMDGKLYFVGKSGTNFSETWHLAINFPQK